MNRLTLVAMLALAASASLANAAQPIVLHARTAGELADLCGADTKSPGADARINYCHGFAQGVVDLSLRRAGDTKPFCFPNPTPTRTATMTEFVNWVRSLPDRRKLEASDGLLRFMGERFPCK